MIKAWVIQYIISSAFAVGTSVAAIQGGCTEGAPVAHLLPAHDHPAVQIAFKSGATYSVILMAQWGERRKPGYGKVVLTIGSVVNVIDGARNLHLLLGGYCH